MGSLGHSRKASINQQSSRIRTGKNIQNCVLAVVIGISSIACGRLVSKFDTKSSALTPLSPRCAQGADGKCVDKKPGVEDAIVATATPAVEPSPTGSPTSTPSPTVGPTASPSPTASPTTPPTATPKPTASPSPTATPKATPSPTATPKATETPDDD